MAIDDIGRFFCSQRYCWKEPPLSELFDPIACRPGILLQAGVAGQTDTSWKMVLDGSSNHQATAVGIRLMLP